MWSKECQYIKLGTINECYKFASDCFIKHSNCIVSYVANYMCTKQYYTASSINSLLLSSQFYNELAKLILTSTENQ